MTAERKGKTDEARSRPPAHGPEAFQSRGSKRKSVWHESSPVACLLGLSLASMHEMDGAEARLEASLLCLLTVLCSWTLAYVYF